MQAFKIIGLLALAAVLAVLALIVLKITPRVQPALSVVVTNFEECVAAGNPVMESYPRQCRSADGRLFVEEIQPPQNPDDGLGLQANGCAVAGCSSQLCVSADEAENIMSTCEFRAEYACYREASCAPQQDGKCDWTQTAELKQCLASPPDIEGNTLEVM